MIKQRKRLVRPRPTASYAVGLSERGKKYDYIKCPFCGNQQAVTDGHIARCGGCLKVWRVSK